jgi:hypothetical protein
MAKRFNGQKMSHGHREVAHRLCPLCGTQMKMFLGKLRCTHLVKSAGGERRVIKHGSLSTVEKRAQQIAAG